MGVFATKPAPECPSDTIKLHRHSQGKWMSFKRKHKIKSGKTPDKLNIFFWFSYLSSWKVEPLIDYDVYEGQETLNPGGQSKITFLAFSLCFNSSNKTFEELHIERSDTITNRISMKELYTNKKWFDVTSSSSTVFKMNKKLSDQVPYLVRAFYGVRVAARSRRLHTVLFLCESFPAMTMKGRSLDEAHHVENHRHVKNFYSNGVVKIPIPTISTIIIQEENDTFEQRVYPHGGWYPSLLHSA